MELNLPSYKFKIKNIDGANYIFDQLRKKFIMLTPEEWVRQNFIAFLISEKKYPQALMGNEISLNQNGIKRRCDTLVTDKFGNPLVIIEYKAPEIVISQEVFDQITRYNSVYLVKYLIVSNGINHYCCKIDYENNKAIFLKEIPLYSDL